MPNRELQMPANVEAERAILGAVLLDNRAYEQAAAFINPDDFSLDSHRRIYCAMVELAGVGKPIDLMFVVEQLGKLKQVEAVGGVAYLSSLTDGLPHRAHIDHYVKSLRDKSNLRKIINACQGTIAEAMEQTNSAESVAAGLQEELLALQCEGLAANGAKSAREFMPAVLHELEEECKHNGLIGYTTGISSLDTHTTGIRAGDMWVVGALPSRGKTAFGIGLLGDNLKNGVPCLMFSLEMKDRRIGRRLLANYSGVSSGKLRDPKYMTKPEWQSVTTTAGDIMEWPLYVDDASSITTKELVSRARLYIRKFKVKIIVVDYLMLVREPEARDLRVKAGNIANALRQVAKDEGVAVVLLSQLSRPRDGDINTKPNMLSLRESGDIEAAAETVCLLYMPLSENAEPTGEELVIVGKQREGWLGEIPVTYNRERLKFCDRGTQ